MPLAPLVGQGVMLWLVPSPQVGLLLSQGGGGRPSEDDVPAPPACVLSFATPRAEVATQSVSSLSWSTKTHSTKASGGKRNSNIAPNSSQPKKKAKQGEDDDGSDVSIQDGKEDKDIDFLPITDQAMETPIEGKGMWEMDDSDFEHGIKMRHREAFMAKAFPIELGIQSHASVQVQSGSTKTCRPQSEVDYIIHVINH